jgi:hypothetical protein
LATGLILTTATGARAAAPMNASDRAAISNLIDRFVKDVVLRRNLAEGWTLAGPELRGGTSRKAWISGTGVTVAPFPARGDKFTNSWTGQLISPNAAQLSVILIPRAGSGYNQTAASVDVRRLAGHWIVNAFYFNAVFRSGKKQGSCGLPSCAISGPNDFGAAGGSEVQVNQPRVGAHWIWIVMAVVGTLVVAIPLGFFARMKRRERRAWKAYSDS